MCPRLNVYLIDPYKNKHIKRPSASHTFFRRFPTPMNVIMEAHRYIERGHLRKALPILIKGFENYPTPAIASSLITTYGKLGNVSEAEKVFLQANKFMKVEYIYRSIVNVFLCNNDLIKSLYYFREYVEAGYEPLEKIFLKLLDLHYKDGKFRHIEVITEEFKGIYNSDRVLLLKAEVYRKQKRYFDSMNIINYLIDNCKNDGIIINTKCCKAYCYIITNQMYKAVYELRELYYSLPKDHSIFCRTICGIIFTGLFTEKEALDIHKHLINAQNYGVGKEYDVNVALETIESSIFYKAHQIVDHQ